MKIIVGVPDTVVRSIKLGQPIEVAIDAFPTRTFHARISRMSSAADATTRNFDVEVAIPNRDHLLKTGMIGSLALASDAGEKHASSLLVPISAIVQRPTASTASLSSHNPGRETWLGSIAWKSDLLMAPT